MRRDAFIQNDSGGFSVVCGHAVDDIIEDARANDERFVRSQYVLLLELIGDDSLPVRVVVDEPLHDDEQAEWIARIRSRLDVADGRVLVMGGFDPDVLAWWRDDHGPDEDGTGVAVVHVPPGTWDLDAYTFAGSLNGNVLLRERGPEPIGRWFRRDHPDAPVPLWLARVLDYSGEEDPGHEQDWRETAAAFAAGRLEIDTAQRGFVGLLFHLHTRPAGEALDPPPGDGWFARDTGARQLDRCPRGIAATVEDPDLVSLARRLTGERVPEQPFVWGPRVDVSSRWKTQSYPVVGGGAALELTRAWHAWAIAALCSDNGPAFEVRVTSPTDWQPQHDDMVSTERAGDMTVLGSPTNLGGWTLWHAMRALGAALSGVPDGATIELLTALDDADVDDPEVGRLRMSGTVSRGRWLIDAAAPPVTRTQLRDAFAFMEHLFEKHWLVTRTAEERAQFARTHDEWKLILGDDIIERNDDVVVVKQADDIRNLVLLGQSVFRTRFAGVWPMDGADDDDDEDDDDGT